MDAPAGVKLPASLTLAEPALFGRDIELAELERCLDLAIKGEGSTIFISGEAGSGKTKLSKEFLDSARNKGIKVLAGWCLSNAADPYFPFVEAFNSLELADDAGNILDTQQISIKTKLTRPISIGTSYENEVSNTQIWKDQTFAAITKELLLLSTINPTILFIDDIHWADSASIALLHYISRAISSERILILATFRSEETKINRGGQPHPLADVLRLMGREGLIREIKLSGLSQSAIAKVAESMLGGSLNKAFAEKLSKESQGNPLFVVESLRMMYGQGSLLQENGQWRLIEGSMGVPDKVRDVIMRRLSALVPNQRRILDVASIIGEKFDPKLLASALSEKTMNLLEELNKVAESTLLVFDEDNYYRFKHAKVQELLCSEIPPLLKKEYHSVIAESLEARNPDSNSSSFSDIAYHYAQAGNEKKAVKYSLAAGQDALKRWSNVEAIKHFRYVLQIVGATSETIDKKIVAVEGLGDAYYANNNFKEATDTFGYLAEIENGAAKLRALRKAMFASWFKGDLPLLEKFTKLAEENATADRLESARVLHQKARYLGVTGQMKTCLEMIDQALIVFEEEYAIEDAAWVLFAGGHAATMQGFLEKGLAAALRAIALYDEIGDFRSQMEAYLYAGFCFQDCTLHEEAISMFKKVIQINDELKMGDYVRLIPAFECWAVSLQGDDLGTAISKTLQALEWSEKTDSKLYLGLIYGTLVGQYVTAGDRAKADEYFEKLVKLPKVVLSTVFSVVCFNLALAIYYASKNDFEKSYSFFKEHFKFIRDSYRSPGTEVGAKQAYAWVLNRQGKREEAISEMKQAQTIVENAQKRFQHVNICANLMTFTKIGVNQTFEIRLDIVNVSRTFGKITRIENLLIPSLEIINSPSECLRTKGSFQFKKPSIGPFQVKTIKLTVRIPQSGTYILFPTITYVDDLGKHNQCKPRSLTISVQPTPFPRNPVPELDPKLEFISEQSKKVLNYLTKASDEDYHMRLFPKEKSGWRSLMQIVKESQVTKHSMYGQTGQNGEVVAELRRLRLVDAKVFGGERGRGGNILKLRVVTQEQA
jgi:tetratricopeptide (TPR) repeat protein